MRVSRSSSTVAFATSLVAWLAPLVYSISVPTGKVGPITPARIATPTANPLAPAAPAPVVEYSAGNPEPPPLNPNYVPPVFNYFDTLAKHHVYYVPVRYRNFNAPSNSIDYEPQQKYFGQTLGKNIGYKPYKQQLYTPWNSQYNNQNTNQYNSQYNNVDSNQFNNQYNNQQTSQFGNQYNAQQSGQYTSQYNNQNNNQYNVQPTQQQQKYEAVSTQTAPVTTGAPQPQPQAQGISEYRKVDYSTGKGSYDVTGKGGSKSEYYGVSKDDWSKKSIYPKKALGQSLTSRKYVSHKY